MKNSLYILLFSVFLTACGSKSVIITSKNEAVKKQVYQEPTEKSTPISKKVRESEVVIVEKSTSKKENFAQPLYSSDDQNLNEFINTNSQDISYLSRQIIDKALENIGSRYQTGGTTKAGFDCSGLMYASFGFYDIKLPRTSNEMSRFGTKIDPKTARKGDLIFFRTLGNKQINHVGLVIEVNEDEIKFVHASIKLGVIVSTTKEGYYKKTFAQVNRVLE